MIATAAEDPMKWLLAYVHHRVSTDRKKIEAFKSKIESRPEKEWKDLPSMKANLLKMELMQKNFEVCFGMLGRMIAEEKSSRHVVTG